jgi:hypothetical protein
MTTHTDPTTEARRLYGAKLRYSEVISLCALFHLSTADARNLIEGPGAVVKGKTYGSTKRRVKGEWVDTKRRAYYDREDVIAACQ